MMACSKPVKHHLHHDEIRLLLIGKTGVGKSSTANTLLGKDEFTTSLFGDSETQKCQIGTDDRFGRKLVVVDTPGFFDSDKSNDEICIEICRCCALASPGFHAILFVIDTGRFTDESKRTINIFFEIFGLEVSKFTFIVLTHFDELKKKKVSLDQFIAKSGPYLQQMVLQCEDRVIPFDNEGTTEDKDDQTLFLIWLVTSLRRLNRQEYFYHEIFDYTETLFKEQLAIITHGQKPYQDESVSLEEEKASDEERGRSIRSENGSQRLKTIHPELKKETGHCLEQTKSESTLAKDCSTKRTAKTLPLPVIPNPAAEFNASTPPKLLQQMSSSFRTRMQTAPQNFSANIYDEADTDKHIYEELDNTNRLKLKEELRKSTKYGGILSKLAKKFGHLFTSKKEYCLE